MKLIAYMLVLGVIFSGAWVAGAAAGPIAKPQQEAHVMAETHVDMRLPGLAAADNGYRLDLQGSQFRILGDANKPITAFDVEHEKRLHFIVVRRDGAGYQHLHPTMAADGTWTVPLTLTQAGSYRVFADFKPSGGIKTTLGTDIQVPGQYEPATDTPNTTATTDGYQVDLTGDLEAGKTETVTATISKDGRPVTDLQPYLGAQGHLVALRATDLGYLHVHPLENTGPQIRFAVEVPTDGRYRLYLDFQHNGKVRTAQFTVDTHGKEAH
ncbi:hypothetical protein [Actinocrispum sp. NPDC049592]|uniref:hypothetical protein n=1 Tax=Actinocrispum sp. NPDC049592 TaxID=3154835 RepID=UPI003417B9C0